MFYYARSDTHYLLYIYDMMRNELLQQTAEESGYNLMNQVLDRSKETSLRRHETSTYDAENGQGPFGWYNLLIRQSAGKFSKEQFAVFRAVHKWRDEMARREDESSLFVMSNATLFDIARRIPPDPKALHSLVDSTSHIAKREAFNLFKIISKAKAQGVNGPTVTEVIRSNAPPTMGIGEVAKSVLPQLRSNDAGASGIQDVVSQISKLWGKVPISSRWEESSTAKTRAVQFELPWAQFIKSGKVLEVIDTPAQEPVAQMEESIIHLEENQAADSEFTLKAGLKRKAPEIESDSESGEVDDTPSKPKSTSTAFLDTDEIAVPDSDDSEEQRRERKAKKAEKKARKEALKEERRQAKKLTRRAKKEASTDAAEISGKGGDEEDEDEPFDYSKAKSVLNASRAANSAPQAARFNPYGMTIDGPKPARKMHGEKPGKSATFRR